MKTRSATYSPPHRRHVEPAVSGVELKQIMVPIDFSCCSRKALRYASAIAQDHGATVILLHILPRDSSKAAVSTREKQLRLLARHEMDPAVPIRMLVKTGMTPHEIVSTAKAMGADLLVISTHGRGYLPDFCFRSMAEEIVRYAPCPTLVIREQEHDFLRRTAPQHDPPKVKTNARRTTRTPLAE